MRPKAYLEEQPQSYTLRESPLPAFYKTLQVHGLETTVPIRVRACRSLCKHVECNRRKKAIQDMGLPTFIRLLKLTRRARREVRHTITF